MSIDTLPEMMNALIVPAPGAPLELQRIPTPSPGPGEVLVRVAASPINPSDLLMIRGDYGQKRPFPFVPGLEGSGRVVASGGGFLGRSIKGKLVACAPERDGLWQEYAVVSAKRCVPLPSTVSAGPGAMSFVNPLTAIALVEEAARTGCRAAVSTAAGGALGRMIRARGKEKGVTIINVVRRSEQAAALREEGVQHVLATDMDNFDAALGERCAQLDCRLAFDAVGGEMTSRLAEALQSNGEILVYGGLSDEKPAIDPATIIFKGLSVRGFWLTQWSAEKSFLRQVMLTREIHAALQGGFAETRVAQVVPLIEGASAPRLYAENMSLGKVLISTDTEELGLADVPTGPTKTSKNLLFSAAAAA